jgi:hypothetical protein
MSPANLEIDACVVGKCTEIWARGQSMREVAQLTCGEVGRPIQSAASLFCPPVPPVIISITPQPNFILDPPLVFVRATDDERIIMNSSPRIDGGNELLVAHIELIYY